MLFDKDEDGVLTFHELQQELFMIFILHINLVSIEGDASSGTETRDQRSAADGQESNAFRFARTSRDLFLSVGTRFYSDLDFFGFHFLYSFEIKISNTYELMHKG